MFFPIVNPFRHYKINVSPHCKCHFSVRLTLKEVVLGVLVGVVGGADDVEGAPAGQHFVEEHAQRPPEEGTLEPYMND